jgi:hypothetical protein
MGFERPNAMIRDRLFATHVLMAMSWMRSPSEARAGTFRPRNAMWPASFKTDHIIVSMDESWARLNLRQARLAS